MGAFESGEITGEDSCVLSGVWLDRITEAQTVEHVLSELDAARGGVVITPNLDIVRQCPIEPDLRQLLAEADLRVADGMTLVWASRLSGQPLPERVCGSNLISSVTAGAALRGRSVFLLGGTPGTAERAAEILKQRHPELHVAGTFCPDFGFERDPQQIAEIVAALDAAQPDIVFVALGFPKAERLIQGLRDNLPRSWWIGVGISFSFLCGDVKRAPRWMQRSGLEWVHRLIQEPRRLARRYIIDGPPFAIRLLAGSIIERGASSH